MGWGGDPWVLLACGIETLVGDLEATAPGRLYRRGPESGACLWGVQPRRLRALDVRAFGEGLGAT